VTEKAQGRSGGCIWVAEGHTSNIDGNGNTIFLLGDGLRWQESGDFGQYFYFAGMEGTYVD